MDLLKESWRTNEIVQLRLFRKWDNSLIWENEDNEKN
jgi:hypothetical protein